ncbi:MAG: hypothetical protein RSD81_06525 [Pseudomonas sp.]
MSLETDVANLVTKTTDLIAYFNGKKAGIDAAVAAAVAAVPLMERIWYVNQLSGDDSAAGTLNAPLKTIDKAASNTPAGGVCVVRLQTDYVHSTALVSALRVLNILSDVVGTKRKLSLVYRSDGEFPYLSGFGLPTWGAIGLKDIQLVYPSPAGMNPAPVGSANAMLKIYSANVSSIIALKLDACDVQAPADFSGCMMPANGNAIAFESIATSYPTGWAGRYISGVAAGTDTKTLSNVMTNLATL